MAHYIGQPTAARACALAEAQIRRFQPSVRRRLRKLTVESPWVRDLLYTHPGAAFVLVAGNRVPDARGEALRLVKRGRPLAEVDSVLELPRWLRRLPPEAFVKPLGPLPCGHEFGRRIVSRIPAQGYDASVWLERMTLCTEACDGEMALWLGGKRLCSGCCKGDAALALLGAFVWFSQRPELLAHRFMEKPWNSKMRLDSAVEAAGAWLARIVFGYCAETGRGDGTWYKERKSQGYRILPLRSAAELMEEGTRMKHCVGTYAGRVAAGLCLIYSIRRGNDRVATLEIAPAPANPENAEIVQLQGSGNTMPGQDVWRAVQAWLAQRGGYPHAGANRVVHEGRWREVWQPYCAAKPQAWLYFLGDLGRALTRVYSDMNALTKWHEL